MVKRGKREMWDSEMRDMHTKEGKGAVSGVVGDDESNVCALG